MQNKTRLELADYEAENLARLQKMFSRKWEFIFMQAEAQAKYGQNEGSGERCGQSWTGRSLLVDKYTPNFSNILPFLGSTKSATS